jgi:hypothetical protein
MDEIDDLILEALSFYDQMTINDIIMNLDEIKIQDMPYFNMMVLEERIKKLMKKKYVIRTKHFKEYRYQRQVPPRPFWQRLGL